MIIRVRCAWCQTEMGEEVYEKIDEGSHPSAMGFALSANDACSGILKIPGSSLLTVKQTNSQCRSRSDCGKKRFEKEK